MSLSTPTARVDRRRRRPFFAFTVTTLAVEPSDGIGSSARYDPTAVISVSRFCETPVGVGCGIAFSVAAGPYSATFDMMDTEGRRDTLHTVGACEKPPGLLCYRDDLVGTPDVLGFGGRAIRWTITGENAHIEGVFPVAMN